MSFCGNCRKVKLFPQRGTPPVVSFNNKVQGVIELQDIIKPGIQDVLNAS